MSLLDNAGDFGRRLVDKVWRPDADPTRAARVYRFFDERAGFRRYHDACRSRLGRPVSSDRSDLLTRGIQYLDIMPGDDASRLLTQLTSNRAAIPVKKGNPHLLGHEFKDDVERIAVLESLLTPDVDRLFVDFFGSEYLVYWMLLSRADASNEQRVVSFKWHCDKGPAAHLKLLFYLNGTDEHGGNTAFIDLHGSTRLAQKGYLFGRVSRRTSALGKLSALAGSELRTVSKPMRAGEAVVFPPATVLHRGLPPLQGARYVLTLCVLPSPVHWRQAFDRGVICDLAHQAKWPGHADALARPLIAQGRPPP